MSTDALQSVPWKEITTRMAHGDREAFRIYYEHFFAVMYQEAIRWDHTPGHAPQDVVQEAMLKAMRCMRPLDSAAGLVAFSRTLVRCVCLDLLRAEHRRRRRIAFWAEQAPPQNSAAADAAVLDTAAIDAAAQTEWLQEQLSQLEPELRRLLDWRFRLGWRLKRIAEQLGMKTGAVDGRIRRALQQLKTRASAECLDAPLGEPSAPRSLGNSSG